MAEKSERKREILTWLIKYFGKNDGGGFRYIALNIEFNYIVVIQ